MTNSENILAHIIDDFGNAIPVHTLEYGVYMIRYGWFKWEWE